MIAMDTNQPSTFITQHKLKKNNLQNQKSKTFQKIFKEVDGGRNITVKAMTNPYKRFRNKKKRGLLYTICQKAI